MMLKQKSINAHRAAVVILVIFVFLGPFCTAEPLVRKRDLPACEYFSEGLSNVAAYARAESIQPFNMTKWESLYVHVDDLDETVEFETTNFDIDNDGIPEVVLRYLWIEHNGAYEELYVLPKDVKIARNMLSIKNWGELTNNRMAVKRGAGDQVGANDILLSLVTFKNRNYVLVQRDLTGEESARSFSLVTYSGKPDLSDKSKWGNDVPSVRLDLICTLPFVAATEMAPPKLSIRKE